MSQAGSLAESHPYLRSLKAGRNYAPAMVKLFEAPLSGLDVFKLELAPSNKLEEVAENFR